MNNPLLDNEFITALMEHRQRETYARITLLTKDELPVEYIEGRVTGGSINVDGNSALRRTCNLTLILKDKTEVNNFQWTFKSKFKLEIGIKNTIDPRYPDIIWFKQGTFILTSCNMNQTVNNYTITVSGKDKMCLLNGDLGGNLTSSVDFGVEEYYDKAADEVTYNKILLKDIIRNVVQTFGGELAENIIINDLDQSGLELLEYRGQTQDGGDLPLYLFRNTNDSSVEYVTLDEESKQVFIDGQGEKVSVVDSNIKYATTSDLFSGNFDAATKVTFNLGDKSYYNIIKLTYGDLAGYRITDLTYAGDLKANVGETLVSVLDKIVKMLSNFEYYYNLDGKFVFQKKRIYISTPWGGQEQDSNNIIDAAINDSYPKINLTNAQLTTAFANNPNLLNIKNDFSVWGTYKSISGADIPIHMRYALDTKPTYYKTIRSIWTRKKGDENAIPPADYVWYRGLGTQDKEEGGYIYTYLTKPFSTVEDGNSTVVDWREIIYQMAADYYADSNWTKDDFLYRVGQANPTHYPFGKTGYEQYYTDIQGFWRNLYDPDPEPTYEEVAAADLPDWNSNDWKSDIYYIDHYYDIVKNVDDIDNYDINDLYIITTIDGDIVTAENLYPNKKKVFAPFVGSKVCCLYADSEYYYYTGKEYVATKDAQKLNLRDLTEIYYYKTADQTYDLMTTKRKSEWVEDNYTITGPNYSLHRFWVKKDERVVLNETSPKGYCRIIYRDGISNNKNYIQYLTRWDYLDNFGNLANSSNGTPSEVSERITYYRKNANGEYNSNWWNKAVSEDPNSLIFWFDFLNVEDTDLYKYSVKEIGSRTKAINDSNVKSIYYRDVPNVIFTQDIASEQKQTGYTYIQTPPGYQSLFSISGRGKSAKERVDELLQEHSYAIEQTTITTVPLYHLEPNTRIYVRDEMSNIDGEYIVTKLTIPLTHNGSMSLSTNKVVSNIL